MQSQFPLRLRYAISDSSFVKQTVANLAVLSAEKRQEPIKSKKKKKKNSSQRIHVKARASRKVLKDNGFLLAILIHSPVLNEFRLTTQLFLGEMPLLLPILVIYPRAVVVYQDFLPRCPYARY
ncbi:uncharacterized protein LOC112459938 [Temnothorax curvispinosus]|uniref:Uncharacterized protein LOC112459938 n=1 Tax=Temnothorax curvispinosus TaxID=300111 RepID=A0A6J1QCR1_9HYME|nr:uncharacterized protein LOC112459938 [Temnothorax curvispinosus]